MSAELLAEYRKATEDLYPEGDLAALIYRDWADKLADALDLSGR